MTANSRAFVVLLLVGSAAARAFAQSPGDVGKWEVEVHAGAARIGKPTDATTAMPAPGDAFTTRNNRPSR